VITLLDGRAGRIDLLNDVVEILDRGDRLGVVGARAERFAHEPEARGEFAFVVARGFARPAVTAECAVPLLVPGGSLIVSEPPLATGRADRWDRETLGKLGVELTFIEARTFRYARLVAVGVCPAEYPRRIGVPEKRPLF
jgi:16S rRNA (guanine527-N7)-methyltransferase